MKRKPGRYLVEIECCGENLYRGSLHTPDQTKPQGLTNLELGEHAPVRIRKQTHTLGDLIIKLIDYSSQDLETLFDERGQLELGRYLYRQVFGQAGKFGLIGALDGTIDLRIITRDEHISRLPWALLANDSGFLAAAGCSVSLSASLGCGDHTLPPSPRMLIVMPQPIDQGSTNARSHIDEMQRLLLERSSLLSRGRKLLVVSSWEEFRDTMATFEPEVVYYYGHGAGDRYSSHLIFSSPQGVSLPKPIADFADCLRAAKHPPVLVYLNCCRGDAGGLLGAGHQLSNFIPAVITNFTIAEIPAAQPQALALWRSILLDGNPPHIAIREIRTDLGRLGLSFGDMRWVAPVMHCSYDDWEGNPPPRPARERDLHWRYKLDRANQYGVVSHQVREMIRKSKPRCLAYIWYGKKGQGLDIFHQRLKEELQQEIQEVSPGARLIQFQPDWPEELDNPHRSFLDMLTDAFEVHSLKEIQALIQAQGHRGPTLLYVRHRPVRSSKLLEPKDLRKYLEWWDCNFASVLSGQVFALLGISFEVGQPRSFLDAVEKELASIQIDRTSLRILDEMDRLAQRDLEDFIREHDISLPRRSRDAIIKQILDETGGEYEMTLERIKHIEHIVEEAWEKHD